MLVDSQRVSSFLEPPTVREQAWPGFIIEAAEEIWLSGGKACFGFFLEKIFLEFFFEFFSKFLIPPKA